MGKKLHSFTLLQQLLWFYKTGEEEKLEEDNQYFLRLGDFVSSDRSSYSDGGLLYIDPQRQLFEISSISANIFSCSF